MTVCSHNIPWRPSPSSGPLRRTPPRRAAWTGGSPRSWAPRCTPPSRRRWGLCTPGGPERFRSWCLRDHTRWERPWRGSCLGVQREGVGWGHGFAVSSSPWRSRDIHKICMINSALLRQKEASDNHKIWERDVFRLELACSICNPSFEQKHSSCWKISESRHDDHYIDVNVHDRHMLLIYEKCNFQVLLPFDRVGLNCHEVHHK